MVVMDMHEVEVTQRWVLMATIPKSGKGECQSPMEMVTQMTR